jgi:biopolymer transport protein ExbB
MINVFLLVLAGVQSMCAQGQTPAPTTFDQAAATLRQQLEESVAELSRLRDQIAEEKLPLSRQLNELEAELIQARAESREAARQLDGRAQDLVNLQKGIKDLKEQSSYMSGLLGDYGRQFESRLHIAELQRYAGILDAVKLAPDDRSLAATDVFRVQADLVRTSLDRLSDVLGGAQFEGQAVGPDQIQREGTFVVVGPTAIFHSTDGAVVGTVETRLGSLEPTVVGFANPDMGQAAKGVAASLLGNLPFDPTMGNAHKIEATEQETLIEHVRKGGPVMVPIFVMAGLGLLIAVYKWVSLSLLRRPSKRRVKALMAFVDGGNRDAALQEAAAIKGPVGLMLSTGVAHLDEPRELIEEVMYEEVLRTRLRLERFLPFIAICAASAPLLGLLGTVTGIINTFKMITVFGSGDVKSLSGGISEALITTKFGLIVAIPSLLLHAFLSRKVRGVIGDMETAAVSFVNQVSRTSSVRGTVGDAPTVTDTVRSQVNEVLRELLGPILKADQESGADLARTPRSGGHDDVEASRNRRPATIDGHVRPVGLTRIDVREANA